MPYSGAMTRRTTRHRGRRRPPKKPLEKFLDGVARTLETMVSTAVFSGGAVLLGRILGAPPAAPQLPPGLPPEVVDEWGRITGWRGKPGDRPRRGKAGETAEREPPPAPKPVQLLKGPDGVYRPEN